MERNGHFRSGARRAENAKYEAQLHTLQALFIMLEWFVIEKIGS